MGVNLEKISKGKSANLTEIQKKKGSEKSRSVMNKSLQGKTFSEQNEMLKPKSQNLQGKFVQRNILDDMKQGIGKVKKGIDKKTKSPEAFSRDEMINILKANLSEIVAKFASGREYEIVSKPDWGGPVNKIQFDKSLNSYRRWLNQKGLDTSYDVARNFVENDSDGYNYAVALSAQLAGCITGKTSTSDLRMQIGYYACAKIMNNVVEHSD